jgi:hypothetical protein
MSETDTLRASRDGDQFHYYWAARRCLRLLLPSAALVGVNIEGPSRHEGQSGDSADAGHQVIDIAEYYGSERLQEAELVVYLQLKHSTERSDKSWTASELKRTLAGFGKKFSKVAADDASLLNKLRFRFVSNRTANSSVLESLEDLAKGNQIQRHPRVAKLLTSYVGLSEEHGTTFWQLFEVDRRAPSLLPLIGQYETDVRGLLPGFLGDSGLRLKELVSGRATSLGGARGVIARADVLTALGAQIDDLLPAPSQLLRPSPRFDREVFTEMVNRVLSAASPIIIHAAGGTGKSVFADALPDYLPEGSVCIAYDCFGRGGYRRSSEPRHKHRQGLVQIANELAGRGYCDLLVPTPSANASQFMTAFLSRLQQAVDVVRSPNPAARLVIVVDAADNAVMAAEEFDDTGPAFVVDLLREVMPEEVKLVMLCRSERLGLLKAPPGVVRIELPHLDMAESKEHLTGRFADASDSDAAEFHKRTAGNPRVQANALEGSLTVAECLSTLGDTALAPDAALDHMFHNTIEQIRDTHGANAKDIDSICEALAALRPRIPVQVISQLYDIDAAAVRSFISDFGLALLLDEGTVQFRDEPTETWFRTNFNPRGAALPIFLKRLRPLADSDVYVATSLPQILWNAGRLDELVQLALRGQALPDTNELERAELEQQRVQFALKAALRSGARSQVARLALKAGTLSAGHSRRLRLIRNNTDLAGEFLDPQTIEDLVATRALQNDWPGSNLAYEGCLMASSSKHLQTGRSRLRSSIAWMTAWTRLPADLQGDNRLEYGDMAEVALGLVRAEGPAACARFLGSWRPRELSFHIGLIVAARLIDRGLSGQLSQLAITRDIYLQWAVASQACRHDIELDPAVAKVLAASLQKRKRAITFKHVDAYDPDHYILFGVVGALTAALKHNHITHDNAKKVLDLYLSQTPPRGLGSWPGSRPDAILKAWALRALLNGEELTDRDLAHPELAQEMDGPKVSRSRDLVDFKANITPAMPWAAAWAQVACEPNASALSALATAAGTLSAHPGREPPIVFLGFAARVCAQLLSRESDSSSIDVFRNWLSMAKEHLLSSTLIDVVGHCARSAELEDVALDLAAHVSDRVEGAREDAQSRTDTLVRLGRAIYALSPPDCGAYFDRAVSIADKIGDDVWVRWRAIDSLARNAATMLEDDRRAYGLAVTAEALQPYLSDGLDYEHTIRTIARLSPRSALAIASRWRDRDFGYMRQLVLGLTQADDFALSEAPVSALAFMAFCDDLDVLGLLRRATEAAPTDAQLIVDRISEFDRANRRSPQFLREIKVLAKRLNVDLSNSQYGSSETWDTTPTPHPETWAEARSEWEQTRLEAGRAAREQLVLFDCSTSEGMEQARKLVTINQYLSIDDLIDRAFDRPRSRWHEVINTFAQNQNFGTHEYRGLLQHLRGQDNLPASAQAASRNLAEVAVIKFCVNITTTSWDPLPLNVIADFAGMSAVEIFDAAARGLGARSELLDAESCFALAGRVAAFLTSDEASEAFDGAIEELAYLVEPTTADGPWSTELEPPASVHECIAGYVWSALGDPSEEVRWRAAHAVKLLCDLERTPETEALARFALDSDCRPFCDRGLVFYDKHARQWLFMAIERCAGERPRAVRAFEPVLRRAVFAGDTHVVLRESAKRSLQLMSASGVIILTVAETERLARVNQPTPDPITLDRFKRSHSRDSLHLEDVADFHFPYDFREHWLQPLARCFDFSVLDLERKASDVITQLWGLANRGHHEEDARHTRGVYGDRKTYLYKYERPPVDDLDFYLATHALMTVAGQLIESVPVYLDQDLYIDQDAEENDFTRWLADHRPTRSDGRWLSDRRDPPPVDQTALSGQKTDHENWRWQVRATDFAEKLGSGRAGFVTLWQHAREAVERAEQTVTVRSALVSRERARALLVALQRANSSMDFRIPSAGDDLEQKAGEYQLSGWVDDGEHREGIDTRDPLAGGVRFPTPQPSSDICTLLGLQPDEDRRIWTMGGADVVGLLSTTWNELIDRGHGREVGSVGHRLEVKQDLLTDLLVRKAMSLVVEVTIDRDQYDYSGKGAKDDVEGNWYIDRSYKIFIADEHGAWYEL